MGGNDEPGRHAGIALCIYRNHTDLRAKMRRNLVDKFGPCEGCGIHTDFVRSGGQQSAYVANTANTSAHGERYENIFCCVSNQVIGGATVIDGRGHIQKRDFVCPLFPIESRELYRVTSVLKVVELYPFDNSPPVDIQAGNHSKSE
jgi:hypothetical protein